MTTGKATCHRPKPRLAFFSLFLKRCDRSFVKVKAPPKFLPNEVVRLPKRSILLQPQFPFCFSTSGVQLQSSEACLTGRGRTGSLRWHPQRPRLGMGCHRRRPHLGFLSPRPPRCHHPSLSIRMIMGGIMMGTTGGSARAVALIGAKPRRGRRRVVTKRTDGNGSANMACKKPSDRSHHGALLFFASGSRGFFQDPWQPIII